MSAQSLRGGTGSADDGADTAGRGDGVDPAPREAGATDTAGRGDGVDPAPREAGATGGARSLLGWLRGGWSPGRLAITLLAAGLVVGLVRGFLVQTFVIPSGSMEPGLQVGDRVVVSRLDYRFGPVQRGDVVVFDGDGLFADARPEGTLLARAGKAVARALGSPAGETDFVKRVIGVGGDHVTCCDAEDRVEVNGTPIDETAYLFPGDEPSATRFDVQVPPGHLWLMGDHRSDSADSREHLGDPGAGMVPVDRVIGRVVAVWWPWDRATGVGRPGAAATPAAAAASAAAGDVTTARRAVRPGQEGTP